MMADNGGKLISPISVGLGLGDTLSSELENEEKARRAKIMAAARVGTPGHMISSTVMGYGGMSAFSKGG